MASRVTTVNWSLFRNLFTILADKNIVELVMKFFFHVHLALRFGWCRHDDSQSQNFFKNWILNACKWVNNRKLESFLAFDENLNFEGIRTAEEAKDAKNDPTGWDCTAQFFTTLLADKSTMCYDRNIWLHCHKTSLGLPLLPWDTKHTVYSVRGKP